MSTDKLLLFTLAAAAALGGCKEVDCGPGTIERNGTCQPSEETVGNAMCGPFTMLQGDKCVPMFPPTECDPSTTAPDVDPETGVTTCHGTGGGGCGATLACPPPVAGKQTICGQLYDFENDTKFAAAGATGMKCTTATPDGPCSLSISAYDAISFGMSPTMATPLAVGDVYIDDCGRYKLSDITVPSGPFIGLGIDDADMANRGSAGTTNTVGVALARAAGTATKDFEAWIVKKSTTDAWTSSGGPPLSGGLLVNVFRAHKAGPMGDQLQAGVQSTRGGNPNTSNDYYFTAGQTTRTTIDTSATVTGVNGTVLITNATVGEGPVYAGMGQIPPECTWEGHAGASLANIVFIQLIRPGNVFGETCPL